MKYLNPPSIIAVFGVGGVLVTASAGSYINACPWTFHDFSLAKIFEILGLLVCAVSFALFIFLLGKKIIFFIFSLFYEKTEEFVNPVYVSKPASPNEIKEIHRMGEDLFEGGVSSIKKMKSWHDINPKIFYVIRNRSKPRNAPIEGYFCVIPLKKQALNLLLAGEISGKDFTTDHLAAFGTRCSALYIGAVAGVGFKAKGAALHKLLQHLQDIKEKNNVSIYTRPVTNDGMRICKKFDFVGINSDTLIKNETCIYSGDL